MRNVRHGYLVEFVVLVGLAVALVPQPAAASPETEREAAPRIGVTAIELPEVDLWTGEIGEPYGICYLTADNVEVCAPNGREILDCGVEGCKDIVLPREGEMGVRALIADPGELQRAEPDPRRRDLEPPQRQALPITEPQPRGPQLPPMPGMPSPGEPGRSGHRP